MNKLEPMCVELCANRADRAETVVPLLRAAVDEAWECVSDLPAWLEAQSRFHQILASECGNDAISALVGALEVVWLSHVRVWAESEERAGRFPDVAGRLEGGGIAEHEQILTYIERGEAEAAVKHAQEHMSEFTTRSGLIQGAITAVTVSERFP